MRRAWTVFLSLWGRYERVFWLGTLAIGFAFDLFLAKRPDSVVDNILLVTYLFVCAAIILIMNLRERVLRDREHPGEPIVLILVLQFCFGGLASNLLILYGKSGTLGGSALFVGVLAAFALGNEFLKTRYGQLRLNIAIFYFLLLTYLVIAVPTFVLHQIGVEAFLLSGGMSLGIIALLFAGLYYTVFRGTNQKRQLWEVSAVVLAVFCLFNGLYFLNIIPPVPLSLKEVGIYHALTVLPEAQQWKNGDLYSASYEPAAWYVFWRDTSGTYTVPTTPGAQGSAYCYSAVYAPGSLSTPVVHRWEQYDATSKSWETRSLAAFAINGGRDKGYRGYSIENALTPGAWRCDIETGRGSLIGRITFTVVEAATAPTLSTTTL